MFSIHELNQYYGESHTLWNLTLEVPEGSCTCLMGRNGVSKSTLLKCAMGLLPIRSGTLRFNSVELTRLPAHERATLGIGYVPQGARRGVLGDARSPGPSSRPRQTRRCLRPCGKRWPSRERTSSALRSSTPCSSAGISAIAPNRRGGALPMPGAPFGRGCWAGRLSRRGFGGRERRTVRTGNISRYQIIPEEEAMHTSTCKLTKRYQATIPEPVRTLLDLGAGDAIAFHIEGDEVRLRKARPVDIAFAQALQATLEEWSSEADEEAWRGL